MPFFQATHLTDFEEKLATLQARHDRLLLRFMRAPLRQENAREYAQHGFMRRFGTLRRCLENVFELIPPSTETIPGRPVLYDAQINVQAFFANVYGSVDNLAWIWVHERGLQAIPKSRVGLRVQNTEVRATLSTTFQNYLKSRDEWFEHVIEYRDALAHRIPLYIPPGGVPTRNVDAYNDLTRRMNDALYVVGDPYEYERLSAEQDQLLIFQPMITHSVRETTAHYPFHVQMLADFLTVEEFGYTMLDELQLANAT
ncbi:hypothetical protein ML401_20300 [Bradyrhizobium sp. 62B]|uniref:hypothetical protein n=1 Tax=Bradyrhizobium sp. 62B TaxID=2898442 RepID=UPI002557DFE1|nr:hypothetical protein ML401_20300 [Bradyrhizobium sp. 62B]